MSSSLTKFTKTDDKTKNVTQFVPDTDDSTATDTKKTEQLEQVKAVEKPKSPGFCCGSCS
ncbi:CCGSCS motif protein [Shewanella xiamenensis]|uniref:CCGSCS motif protein n=1 Tax=Shewanella xiamenensis TaxID=332186 RepID=UPI000D6428DB|nr:CCGSCS motif protein [Shewanella xiamenensis]MCT8861360.1 CCGSCS motif protein [Shewanella xiamenensis]MDH1628561.1 CCGSCS motif protein [Shewanella xiamenensis]MDV5245449.1 CCGSCS motif protein [Shewanella xiamenensis]PWH00931.1 CCGSCS motif protein [Shewanella xiamenensis]UWG63436.1 CCGSCS motif protein [Shewanella xiamenensis]